MSTEETTEAAPVVVYAAPDAMKAEIVRQALEANGIPAFIGEQVTQGFGEALSEGEGFWGEIHVPAALAERARALIAEWEEHGSGVSEEALTDAALKTDAPGV